MISIFREIIKFCCFGPDAEDYRRLQDKNKGNEDYYTTLSYFSYISKDYVSRQNRAKEFANSHLFSKGDPYSDPLIYGDYNSEDYEAYCEKEKSCLETLMNPLMDVWRKKSEGENIERRRAADANKTKLPKPSIIATDHTNLRESHISSNLYKEKPKPIQQANHVPATSSHNSSTIINTSGKEAFNNYPTEVVVQNIQSNNFPTDELEKRIPNNIKTNEENKEDNENAVEKGTRVKEMAYKIDKRHKEFIEDYTKLQNSQQQHSIVPTNIRSEKL